jgi:hypothetical protein
VRRKRVAPNPKPSDAEARLAAIAWAEFLFDEYQLEKQKQLTLSKENVTVEKLTNHDKLYS